MGTGDAQPSSEMVPGMIVGEVVPSGFSNSSDEPSSMSRSRAILPCSLHAGLLAIAVSPYSYRHSWPGPYTGLRSFAFGGN